MMREFDNRVLFQMSAADSSNLIDSPIANKLGFLPGAVVQRRAGFHGEVPALRDAGEGVVGECEGKAGGAEGIGRRKQS